MAQFPKIHMEDFEKSPNLKHFSCWPHSLTITPVVGEVIRKYFRFRWFQSGSYIKTWVGEVKLNKKMAVVNFGHDDLTFAFYQSAINFLTNSNTSFVGKSYKAVLPCLATATDHTVMIKTRFGKELYCPTGYYFINVPVAIGFDGWVVSPEVFSSHYHWSRL